MQLHYPPGSPMQSGSASDAYDKRCESMAPPESMKESPLQVSIA